MHETRREGKEYSWKKCSSILWDITKSLCGQSSLSTTVQSLYFLFPDACVFGLKQRLYAYPFTLDTFSDEVFGSLACYQNPDCKGWWLSLAVSLLLIITVLMRIMHTKDNLLNALSSIAHNQQVIQSLFFLFMPPFANLSLLPWH